MKRKSLLVSVVLGINLLFTTSANAALEIRLNGQAVYDTDLNITWLANANYYASANSGSSGAVVWSTAMWEATSNILGVSGWRLPKTLVPDSSCSRYASEGTSTGWGCAGSEMSHLFYAELGGVAGNSILSVHNDNFNLFQNIQSGNYWSQSEEQLNNPIGAWAFGFGSGFQGGGGKNDNLLYAWMVRDGDIEPPPITAIPEPETYALLLAGLGLLGFTVKRRKQNA